MSEEVTGYLEKLVRGNGTAGYNWIGGDGIAIKPDHMDSLLPLPDAERPGKEIILDCYTVRVIKFVENDPIDGTFWLCERVI